MLIVNKKDTRTTMLTIKIPVRRHEYHSYVFLLTLTYFTPFSSVSNVDFEQVNDC